MRIWMWAACFTLGCSGSDKDTTGETGETDTDTDSDADTDTDTDADADTGGDTTYSDIAPILESTCRPCHYMPPATPSGGFELTDASSLVGVASNQLTSMSYVTPGDPDNSYLWHKLAGTQASVGGSGVRMPSASGLPQGDLDAIEAWILGGAQP